MLLHVTAVDAHNPPCAGFLDTLWSYSVSAHLCTPLCLVTSVRWQGLAESYADEVAGRDVQRQNVLASLHKTVQLRQHRTAQQIATHQALVDRQARHCTCCWLFSSVLHNMTVSVLAQGLHCSPAGNSCEFVIMHLAFRLTVYVMTCAHRVFTCCHVQS